MGKHTFKTTKEELERLYKEENYSINGIARRLGRCRKTISYHMDKHGVKKRDVHPVKPKQVGFQYIKNLMLKGMTLEKIGLELECSQSHVRVEIIRNVGEEGYKELRDRCQEIRNMKNFYARKERLLQEMEGVNKSLETIQGNDVNAY